MYTTIYRDDITDVIATPNELSQRLNDVEGCIYDIQSAPADIFRDAFTEWFRTRIEEEMGEDYTRDGFLFSEITCKELLDILSD